MRYRRRLSRKLKQLKGRQSQAVFARRIGIQQSSLNRILHSKQPLNLDMLETICVHLGVDISELMKRDYLDDTSLPESNDPSPSQEQLPCSSGEEAEEKY